MRLSARLTDAAIRPGDCLQAFVGEGADDGAVVSFCGVARGTAGDGSPVSTLRLDHHPRLTELSLQRIGAETAQRFDVSRLLIVHRCGEIAPNEVIVFVAAAARHRRAAFLAADYLMDRLKTEAVFWKKEVGIDGANWIEPGDEDRAALARWETSWPE